MATIAAFIRRFPVASYFTLTFTISWGGVLVIVGDPGGMTGVKAQDNPLFAFAVLAMVAGPSVTSLLLTGLLDGRPGLRELQCRMLKWRVNAGWYAIALLAAPVLATALTLTLSVISATFLPGIFVAEDKTAVLLLGLMIVTPRTTEVDLLAYGLAFAAAVWVVIAAFAIASHRQRPRWPLRRRAA